MNPFVTSGYHSPGFFCDRERECRDLREAIANGRNVMLFSLRRLGKSALIDHTSYLLDRESSTQVIHIDLLPTQSATDFANTLLSAIMEFNKAKHPMKYIAESVLASLAGSKLVFSLDPLTGLPEVQLEPGDWTAIRKTLTTVLGELQKSKSRIVLALDEFQQVCNYPEKGVLAEIRTLTQTYPAIRFIFSGSEETLLTRLFTDPKEPFYRSSQLMQLKRIPESEYHAFASGHFGKTTLSGDDFHWIYDWCNGITFHVQWFCNRLYSAEYKNIGQKQLDETALKILNDFTFQFHAMQRLLTRDQFELLKAIGRENRVYKPTSIRFVTEHRLKLAANVQRSLKALLNKGLVQEDVDEKNRRFYFISDVFLSRWVARV